jgi:predicted DNA-binding transcriptional regulator AlpA
MLKIIKGLLHKILDDIDAGNSNITEKEAIDIVKVIKSYTDKTQRLSKYQACQKLNVSRATFDNLVREGRIPRGQKVTGFKELFWTDKDLNNIIKSRSNDNKKNN